MNRFEAHVQGMKVDEQRYVQPSDLGMDITEFQDFADRLVGTGHAVGDANFIGRSLLAPTGK